MELTHETLKKVCEHEALHAILSDSICDSSVRCPLHHLEPEVKTGQTAMSIQRFKSDRQDSKNIFLANGKGASTNLGFRKKVLQIPPLNLQQEPSP